MDLSALMALEQPALRCPYPLYEEARRDGIAYDVAAAAFVVSRYADAVAVLRDGAGFSSTEVLGRRIPPAGEDAGQIAPLLLVTDDPEHAEKRALVARAFTPKRMRAWEPAVTELCERLADTMLASEEADFVRDFAAPLPIRVITTVLGVPRGDADTFRHWSEEVTRALGGHEAEPERRRAAGEAFRALVGELLDDGEALPEESVLAVIAEAEAAGALSRDESVRLVMELIVAGNITTTDHLANAMVLLCTTEGLAGELRDEPSSIPAFVEEALRLEGPVQGFYRTCTAARTVDGVEVAAGSRMLVLYGAANRDGRRFPEADALDLRRESAAGHVAFGFGGHTCLGAPLARMESRIAFETLLGRTSSFGLAEPEGADGVEYLASFINHGPASLPMRFTRAAAVAAS